MLTRELKHKIHLYKSRGGKTSRNRTARRMLEFVSWCNCAAHQTGKRHVHKFFEEKNFASSTARDYWYAITKLWELMGRVGEPPKPRSMGKE